jgi:serine protease
MPLSCKALTTSGALALALATMAISAPGCAPHDEGEREAGPGGNGPVLDFQSFEEFRASLYREPWPGGAYIVEGDIPVFGDDELRAYYDRLRLGESALVLGTNSGNDIVWAGGEQFGLSYCVDNETFDIPAEKAQIIAALKIAGARWEAIADVHFVYKADQDDDCNSGNTQVLFHVTKVATNEAYFARAFFPKDGREKRQLNVDKLAFEPVRQSTVDDVMTHEFGHILGFRHEHGRAEGTKVDPRLCTEGNKNWHAFTPFDAKSVMAYPECGGFISGQFKISDVDELGVVAIYGSPGRRQPDGSATVVDRIDLGLVSGFSPLNVPFTVRGGSTFVATLRGGSTADFPNLYVSVGAEPSTTAADCAPNVDNDSPETCRIEIPPGPNVEVRVAYQPGGGSAEARFGLTAVYVPGG